MPPAALLIAVLMVTQTIGWGTSFSLLGILAAPIGRDLGLSSGVVYSGVTVMFLVAAGVGPLAGRLSDRFGGLRVLTAGSPVLAAALMLLGLASGPASYVAAWAVFGVGLHLGLATAAYNAIAQHAGAAARRGIAVLTLATGLSSTLFWPLSSAILAEIDWRHVCFLYAALTLALSFPAHCLLAWLYRGGAGRAEPVARPEPGPPHVAAGASRRAFVLLAVALTLASLVGTAMALLLIDLFVSLGTPREGAVFAASLLGIAYLASRGLDVVLGAMVRPLVLATIVFAALPLSLLPMLLWSLGGTPLPVWLAALSAVLYGLPAGMMGILRPSLPFHIFGSSGYGLRLGRLARPIDIANALAPTLFASVMGVAGQAVLLLAIVLTGLALATVIGLVPLVPDRPTPRATPES